MFKAVYNNFKKPPISSEVNWSHPLTRGLDHCYLFNEGNGSIVKNLAKPGYDGIIKGVATHWMTDPKFGPVIFGNGTSVYVDTADYTWDKANFENRGGFSFELWIYFYSTAGRNDLIGSDNNIEWFSGSIYVGSGTDLAWNVPPNNVWTQIVFTCGSDKKGKIVYQNSYVDVSDTTNHYGDGGTNPLRIGGGVSSGIGNFFNGRIAIARIWNRELKPTEIRQLYNFPYCFIVPK